MAPPGSFTHVAELDGWVWTTFREFQWDLNYANPAVFRAMLAVTLRLANRGADVLRLDAAPFLWKRLGTNRQDQPGCSQCEVGFGSHACRNGRCSPAGRPPYCLRTIRSCSPIVASTPEPKRFSPSSTSPTPRRPSDWIYSRLRNQRAGPCSLDAALDEGSMKIVNDAVQLPPDAFLWLGQASDGGTAIQ